MQMGSYFPRKFIQHKDDRGNFVEVTRSCIAGQSSYSTTNPGITRGNHFHTHKIERFAVIKGKALIQLRRLGTDEVFDFQLNGDQPSYVDMPIWYTHNIKNIGEELLYTLFWINEPYDQSDPDTFFELV
jgi:UDP-2-acetamido-2,6-beta-L-arabino-hexul-4-ose reductase